MGTLPDISPRIRKNHPALAHRIRLEKAKADMLEMQNSARRAQLIAADEVSAQLTAVSKAVSRVLTGSKLSPVERVDIERDLAQLTVPRPGSVAPPDRKAKRKRRMA